MKRRLWKGGLRSIRSIRRRVGLGYLLLDKEMGAKFDVV